MAASRQTMVSIIFFFISCFSENINIRLIVLS
jgi:hypothetical protein